MTRGPHLAIACAVLAIAAGAGAHDTPRPDVAPLLQRAEAALQRGDSAAAQAAYEEAAARQHAAHIEVGWVRARMQGGGYRQAVAFAAHAAGAHPDEAEGALLYAHLLSLGGQEAAALGVIERARQRLPNEALLKDAPLACSPAAGSSAPRAELSPPPLGDAVPAQAQVVGSALLLGDARQALVPLALVHGEGPVWVRNGLGRTREARVHSRDEAAGTALLHWAEPLDAPAPLARAPREAFPGSPALAVGHRVDPRGQPAWPQLCTGFLGAAAAPGGGRALGIQVPRGSVGAPVFDNAGRLVGVVGPGDGAAMTLLGARHLHSVAPSSNAGPVALDELYERALRSSLQLIRLHDRNP